MTHEIYKINSFKIVAPYTLEVVFDDTTIKVIDFEPILHGELFGRLRDLTFFNSVFLDEEVHTITWPNGPDFDPAVLHNWEHNLSALIEQSAKWLVAG